MLPLQLQSVAEAEVAAAFDWYRGRSTAAARGFLIEIDRSLGEIQQDPTRYPLVTRTIRRALLSHFPYGVYYRVHRDKITVVGIIHGRRHPRRWRRRE